MTRYFFSLIIVTSFFINGFCQGTQVNPAIPCWYVESFIHTHHSAGSPAPEWEVQFDRVRPDAVQFHPSAWGAGRILSKEYDFAFVATMSRSGAWNDVRSIVESLPLDEQELFSWRVNPDGSPTGRMRSGELEKHLCYYSPGIDKHIMPFYKQATEINRPQQIWCDHTIVTVNLCYCPFCKDIFQNQHGTAPPETGGDPLWDEWVEHHRKGFEGWIEKVNMVVQSVDENILFTANGAYFLAQPEPPPPYVKNLSMDIHSQLMNLSLFARYGSTVGVPFDLMPGLTDRWAGTIPKTMQEVLQAASIIIANGGRWNIGEFPMSYERQPASEMLNLAAAGADLVRERQPWTHRTEAVPLVAILQTASTQYARVIPGSQFDYSNPAVTRLYWNGNRPMPDEIHGAGIALTENNIPYDIINEATLKERLEDYKVLIVGDQFRLDEETLSAIRRFVERGGALLATGRTIESGLDDLLGVRMVSGVSLSGAIIQLGNTSVNLQAALPIELTNAEVMQFFAGGSNYPAITRHASGEGQIIYIAGDFFKTYMDVSPYNPRASLRHGNVAMRGAVADWLKIILPDPGYSCTAPPWIEVALRSKDGNLLVQMVERSFEWRNDLYDTQEPIEFTIALKNQPENVLLQPGNRNVEWSWSNSTLITKIPLDEIKVHSILEVKGGMRYNFNADTISNIPFGTRIDTLLLYLGIDPEINWEIIFMDDIQRPDLKTGDKLIITNSDNTTVEYYLKLNAYKKSSNAQLGAIYLYGDTIDGFAPSLYNYEIILPHGADIPAISANPKDLNAGVRIERPVGLYGGVEERTARIIVTAEDGQTEVVYTVRFEKPRDTEPYYADPFFSNVMNGVHTGTTASGWGKGFEIFNPGSTNINMGNYLIVNATAATLATVVSSKDMLFKMRPGFTIDSSRIHEGIYYKERSYPFNTDLEPGQTLVFGRGFPDGWTTTNVFRDLCDYRDTNGDLDYAYNLYGFVDGARICFFGNNNSLYLIRIDNDSVLNGLKSADDPDDFTLVDIFGAQGVNNNRTIEGTFIDHMSATCLVRKKEVYRGNPLNHGSFGTNEPGSGEWDKYQGAWYIGNHPYIPYSGQLSTVYSFLYNVSEGYGLNQSIGMVPPGTSVDDFMENIFAHEDAHLSLTNSDSSQVKIGQDVLETGDKLNVVFREGFNYTVYMINIQIASSDVTLTSSEYTVNVGGDSGTISGIPAMTSVETLLSNIHVPSGASLTVFDVKNQQVGTEKVLFDTLYVVKTMVSDSIMLEVKAEDRITTCIYKLLVSVDDPYVSSDFYLVRQEELLIDMFRHSVTVRTFLSRLVPSSGSGMKVLDKQGNERSKDDIMYGDDILVVSDGTRITIYRLRDAFLCKDASLRDIRADGITIEGFHPDQKNYVIVIRDMDNVPFAPDVSASASNLHAKISVNQAEDLQGNEEQRTATIRVIAQDGLTEVIYTILFDLNVGMVEPEVQSVNIYSDGQAIIIHNIVPGADDAVEVYNLKGQRVMHRKMTSDHERIYINAPSGIYVVRVKSAGRVYHQKLQLIHF